MGDPGITHTDNREVGWESRVKVKHHEVEDVFGLGFRVRDDSAEQTLRVSSCKDQEQPDSQPSSAARVWVDPCTIVGSMCCETFWWETALRSLCANGLTIYYG